MDNQYVATAANPRSNIWFAFAAHLYEKLAIIASDMAVVPDSAIGRVLPASESPRAGKKVKDILRRTRHIRVRI